jgi:phosphoglycerate dehydrogenase-like enzyme
MTYHLLDQAFFKKFKQSIFINVGRGSIAEPSEIIQSIEKGYLSHAILDVFEQEPLPADSPLWGVPEITITPHISGVSTIDDVIQSFNNAFEQIKNKDLGPLFVNLDKGY